MSSMAEFSRRVAAAQTARLTVLDRAPELLDAATSLYDVSQREDDLE